jgi:hypothetical protein
MSGTTRIIVASPPQRTRRGLLIFYHAHFGQAVVAPLVEARQVEVLEGIRELLVVAFQETGSSLAAPLLGLEVGKVILPVGEGKEVPPEVLLALRSARVGRAG